MKFSKAITTVIITLFLCVGAYAQTTEFLTTRNLGFKESSKVQNVEIKISDNTEALRLSITCGVKKGNVTIEIYDPANEKQGEFSVESMESDDNDSLFSILKEGVTGQINKHISKPQKGTWIIKFIPKNANGRVEIQSWQDM